jgi:hypothetical protein
VANFNPRTLKFFRVENVRPITGFAPYAALAAGQPSMVGGLAVATVVAGEMLRGGRWGDESARGSPTTRSLLRGTFAWGAGHGWPWKSEGTPPLWLASLRIVFIAPRRSPSSGAGSAFNSSL